jgi:hypothetical protein
MAMWIEELHVDEAYASKHGDEESIEHMPP